MKTISIKDFKAHKDLTIKFNKESFLLYGDNGAGKSSIYEAIKYIFFKNKMEVAIATNNFPSAADRDAALREFWLYYNNTRTRIDFTIIANRGTLNVEDYQVSMIQLDDTAFDKYLNLNTLLEKVFFMLPDNYLEKHLEIEEATNLLLARFLESTKIRVNLQDDYTIYVKDDMRNIDETKEIKRYLNEGKINLIVLAILLSVIKIFEDDSKKNVLILDDFITSLDMSNRTFLMKYIFEEFPTYQHIILTHNVLFYNLVQYMVDNSRWNFSNLYLINGEHKLYMNKDRIKLSEIETALKKTPPDFEAIGNKLRKKFERMLYEMSKLFMIGAVEESNKILERVLSGKKIYLKLVTVDKKKKVYNDLVDEIESILDTSSGSLKDAIKRKIKEYEIKDFEDVQKILKELELYKKVSMHSLSHGQLGQGAISKNEIEHSLILLQKLEDAVKSLVNTKVDGL